MTAQFRQMEQELTEAVRLQQEWAERAGQAAAEVSALRASLEELEKERTEAAARQEGELATLREAALSGRQDLEREKMEVFRLEAELAAAQVYAEATARDRAEIERLQSELSSLRQAEAAAGQTRQEVLEEERSEVDHLQKELESLREEREGAQKTTEVLSETWRRLCSLAPETSPGDVPDLADPSVLLDAVRSVETQLAGLKDECRERSDRCAQLTQTMEALQGKELLFL